MRKIVLFAAFACCLVACQTRLEEEFSGITSIYATMEDGTTKTVLSPGQDGVSSVLWSEADELAVFLDGKSQATPFKLSEGAGTKKAVFKGSGGGSKYVAFYPAKMVSSLSGDNVRITLPVEQQYQEGTFANGSFPMLASGNSPDLSFSNMASILRLSLTGKHSVTRIVFKSAQSSIKVCGQATASVSTNKLTVTSNGRDSLVLTTPGVQLSETQPTDFYLVLPPQTYKGGFTVRVYTGERYMDKTIATDFTMERSQMHVADPFVFTPNGMDVSTTLKGGGSENDPFLIESLGDLVFMRDAVNAESDINGVSATEAHYKMMADIDLSPVCGSASGKNWVPIGSEAKPFQGTFNGGDHSIKHLYIKEGGNHQGLFGYANGGSSISHLQVEGFVSGRSYAGLVLGEMNGRGGVIEYCHSAGQVDASWYCGGIVGSNWLGVVNYCINEADITGNSHVGGIAGQIFDRGATGCINHGKVVAASGGDDVGGIAGEGCGPSANCINYGTVSASGCTHVGGIFGLNQADALYSCWNAASVEGKQQVGGIVGRSLQRGLKYNCLNSGSVSGDEYTGGICGYNSSEYSNPATSIKNCLNVGSVISSGKYVGSICAYNEGGNDNNNRLACIVEHNYWLYDPEKSLGMEVGIGVNEGIASNNYALTTAQLTGSDYGSALYKSYTQVLDALNGWAADNLVNESVRLSGWQYLQDGSYPTLTGLDAQRPGENRAVFSVSPGKIELESAAACEVELNVTSSTDYTTEVPDWIQAVDVKTYETSPYSKIHLFRVSENQNESKRDGAIVFTNAEGEEIKVRVIQVGRYLQVNVSSLVISQTGSTRHFEIVSSMPWVISCDADWCTISPMEGTGNAAVSVMASVNEAENARSAIISVASADGSFVQKIAVIQSGKKPDDGSGEEPQSDEWKELPFIHQSVAMRFTATWCGWCPRMNKTIKKAQELYPDKIQHIALHGGGSDLQFNKVDPLMNQYSISGFPTGVIDGRIEVNNGEINATANEMVRIVKETESTYGTVTGVDISSSVSGSDASVSVNVYVKKAGDYKITVLLLEDGIVNAQTDYEDGDHAKYTHDCVARVAMSNVLGDAFNAPDDFSIMHFDYEASVPAACNLENVRVLVYVQRTFGTDRVIQTSSSYGKYYIDNCATVELGSNLRLALEGGSGGGGGEGSGDENEGITPGGEIDM